MKYVSVIFFSILITVVLGTVVKQLRSKDNQQLLSPLVAGDSISQNSSAPNQISEDPIANWPIFVNNYYGYKIKHPTNVSIVNKRNGDISLEKKESISLIITQDVLGENDTINTIIEKAIDAKKSDSTINFNILSNISPISLGSVTAQTYTSVENSANITYYYIPQKGNKYLIITNQTPNSGSADYLTSENIIYSLEFLP